jgi:hypothetical protein
MRTLVRAFAAVLLALGSASSAKAIIMRHDREAARYAALGRKYTAVGFLGQSVTCTLVAPRWALGAAHTVEDHLDARSKLTVVFKGKTYAIDKIILHPKRVRGSVDSSADLVLLHLASPAEGTAPVALYDRDDEPGKIVTIAGYGETGTGLTGGTGERGQLLGAMNMVEAAFEHSLVFTFDPPPGGLELEGLPGPGDSGCPALLEENGKVFLVGVGSFNSGSDETASRYGTLDGFARVSAHRQWITETIDSDPPSSIPMFGPYTKTTKLPETPPGKTAAALIDAFNSGKVGKIADFYRAFARRRSEAEIEKAAAGWQSLMDTYGTYEIRGLRESGTRAIAVYVRAEKAALGRVVVVVLEPEGEDRIAQMKMADVEEPQE